MNRTWTVDIEGKAHKIELNYPVDFNADDVGQVYQHEDGRLLVDGNELHAWKSESEFPKEIGFDIVGKAAVLRKKWFFTSKLDLFIDGQLIRPVL